MLVALLLVSIGAALAPKVNSFEDTPVIEIDSGQLRGYIAEVNNTEGAKVRRYLGIPFAEAERFQNPTRPKPWKGVKNMTSLGKICPQVIGLIGSAKREDISEDCLNLNVFVPDDANSSSLLPVMVWIYGGGFSVGSNRIYDGSYIATLGNVVVVALNYRVSVFGFLTNGKGGDIKGNYGMFDQVEGLKWVNRNIVKFNGDPSKVTIFGESAGGASVSLLLLSKKTKGLFLRAIPQSGDASAFWAAGTYESRTNSIKIFAKNMGCPEDLSQLRECLKPKDVMAIIGGSVNVPFPTFVPVVDNDFLGDLPRVLYDKLDFEQRDVMMGVTNDEGTVFTNAAGDIGYNVAQGLSRSMFVNLLSMGAISMVIPNSKSILINATIAQYTDWTDITNPIRNSRLFVDLQGDIGFVAPAMIGAKAYINKKVTVFYYSFERRFGDYVKGLKLPSWVRAYHGADVSYVFGAPLRNPATSPTDANFTLEIIKMWTNFAISGDPNSPESLDVDWPEYTLQEQKYMALKPNMEVNSHLRASYMAYWNWYIPSVLPHMGSPPSPEPCKCKPCGDAENKKAKAALVLVLSILVCTWFV